MPPASWASARGDPPQVATATGAKAQACPAAPHPPRQEDEWSPSAQRNRPREGEQRAEGTQGWGGSKMTGPWVGGGVWLGPGSSARVQAPPVLQTLQDCGVSGLTSWMSRACPPQGAPGSLGTIAPSSLEGPSVQPPVSPRSGSPGDWGPESKGRG